MFSLKVTHAHSWEMLSTKDSIFQLAVEDLAWGSFLLHRNHYEQVSLCSNQSGNKTERPDDEALSNLKSTATNVVHCPWKGLISHC